MTDAANAFAGTMYPVYVAGKVYIVVLLSQLSHG